MSEWSPEKPMLFSIAMSSPPSLSSVPVVATLLLAGLVGCSRSDAPPPDPLKTQRDAMEKAKGVGKTMQESVDREGRKADEAGR